MPSLIELHVDDFKKTLDFYLQIGFEISWQSEVQEKKGYLVLKLEENLLCFWSGNAEVYNHHYFKSFPQNSPKGYAVEIILQIENIDAYYQSVKQHVTILKDLELKPWGLKDFRIKDCNDFYLRFTEKFNPIEARNF